MVGQWLTAWCASRSDIVATISDRVQPAATSQGLALPRVVYSVIGSAPVRTLNAALGLTRTRLQVEAQAATYAAARALARAIKGDADNANLGSRLAGYQGTLGNVQVQGCHLDFETELYETPVNRSDVGVHRVVMDFIVWHKFTPAA